MSVWDDVRERHLAAAQATHERERQQAISAYVDGRLGRDAMLDRLRQADAAMERIRRDALRQDWVPRRPGRRMPKADQIVAYWVDRGELFQIDPDEPGCFACGLPVDEWGRLERGHLVDRWAGGLDGPQNLVMLCSPCNRVMPGFLPGQEAEAVAWVQNGGSFEVWLNAAMAAARDGMSAQAS